MRRALTMLAAAGALSACASGGGGPAGPPSVAPVAGAPLTAAGRLYLACIRQATEADGVDREGSRLRFRCTGEPARALYDGLDRWTHGGGEGVEIADAGRTVRITTAIREDLTGADHCWKPDAGDAYGCDLNLTVGEFMDAALP